jgi:hypothetical protein
MVFVLGIVQSSLQTKMICIVQLFKNGLQFNKTNLLLVGYLRNQPAEPKRKEGQMKYKIEVWFDSLTELSDQEMSELEDSLVLQIVEPIDSDSNDSVWKGTNIRINIEKEGK